MQKSTLFFIFLKEERKKFEIMKSDILFSDLTVYPVELVNAKKIEENYVFYFIHCIQVVCFLIHKLLLINIFMV